MLLLKVPRWAVAKSSRVGGPVLPAHRRVPITCSWPGDRGRAETAALLSVPALRPLALPLLPLPALLALPEVKEATREW